jgi:PAS domain S-box-containing protein
MLGRNFIGFVAETDIHTAVQAFDDCIKNECSIKDVEFQMKRTDGTTFIGELSGTKFKTGTTDGTLVTIRDISERKKAENALKKSEEVYRFITERSNDLIFVFRLKPEMGFEYVSPSAERITGYTPEDHYNDPMLGMKLIHPDDLHLLQSLQQGIIETSVTKLRWIKKDGSIIWTESQNIPIYDENGELTGMQGRATDITQRHQSEEALRESEKKFHAIIQSQSEGIGIVDINEVFEFTNLAALNIFETDSLIGTSLFDFLPPDEIVKINQQTTNRQKGADGSYEIQIITKKGNARHILVSSSPKFDENGKYVGAFGVFRDITERKKAEEILKQSEAELNFAQEIAKMGSWEHTFKDKQLTGSKQYYSLLGLEHYEKEDMLFEYFLSLVHPEDLKIVDYLNNCPFAKDETKIFDIRLIMPNGTIKWLQNNVVAVYNDGLLVGLKGVNIDITEKKQAEKELKKLSQAVEQSPVMTYITDINGNIEYVNPKLLELTGYSKTELIGQTPRIFSSGEKLQDEYRNLWETIKSGNEWRGEFHNKKKNGELYWSSASLSPIFDTDRNIAHFLAIQEDITQRKIAEYQLRSSEEKYRRIFESVQDAYFEASINGILLEISPSIEIITKGQYCRDEMIGRPFAGVYANAEDRNIYFSKLFEKGRVTDYELSVRNKDGSLIPVAVSAMLSLDANGKPEKITGILRDITERKMAEEILKQSEASLNYSQEIAKMGSWELSVVTGKVSWSKGYYLLVGMQPDNIEGLNEAFNKMVHPDDKYLLDEKLAEIKRERKPASIDLRFILPNGQVKWVQNNIVPVFDGDTLIALKGVNVDITEQKLAEENIKQQNQRLQAIISTLPDIIFVIGLDGIYHEFYCPRPEQLIVPPEKIIGTNISNVFDEENARVHLEKFGECIQSKKLISYEYSIIVNGNQEYFEARLAPFGNDKVLALIRDITKRKQADDEIRILNETLETRIIDRTKQLKDANETLESENQRRVVAEAELALEKQRLADIIEGTNVGTWEWNIQSGDTVFNERWAEIIGYTIEEISPISLDTWARFAHPVDLKASGHLLEKHFKGETDYYSFESRMKHKDGSWVWVLDRGKVHAWDDEGKPLLMSGTHQDITERKKAEDELEWNKTLLELMSNSSPLGFLVVDNRTDNILYFNQRFCQIWEIEHIAEQMHLGELKNNDIIPYCLPVLADIPAFAESCKPLQDELNRIVVEDEIAFTENRTVHRFTTQIRGINDEYFGRFYIFEDITERKRASEFETQLLQLSLQLTGIPNSEIPDALNLALNKIAGFLGADRSYIFEINLPENTMSNTYEWCNQGISPHIEHLQNLACDHLPNWWEKMLRNENIVIPSIQDLPDAWQTEREHLVQQGIQSLIAIPILNENTLIGFVGLDSVTNKREYTVSEMNMLKVWGNMLASLLNHQRQEEIIELTRKNYQTFFNTIDDFLFVLNEQGNTASLSMRRVSSADSRSRCSAVSRSASALSDSLARSAASEPSEASGSAVAPS